MPDVTFYGWAIGYVFTLKYSRTIEPLALNLMDTVAALAYNRSSWLRVK